MSITEGVYALKYNKTYVTGGKHGERVVLQPIGVLPPQDSQKFRVVHDKNKNTYCFLQVAHCHHDGDDAAAASRDGLSFKDAEDRTAIIIGHPRHFSIIIEVFGGTEHFGLTVESGSTEKLAVGLAPEKILPERLDLLAPHQVIYFEFVKVG